MFFSVIVPLYNREKLVGRCLCSVLDQDFGDFEIVVVDDGSDDASLARVGAFADPRIRLLTHAKNRGVCPARNTGIAASRGEWLVFLDSDDELVPGALSRMHALAAAAPESVHALWFRCRMDDGTISPDPLPANREWDYAGFLGFLEETSGRWRDMIRCVRRGCFRDLGYPDNRMLENKFHLDFARRFRSRAYEDILRLYHQDAANQLTRSVKRPSPIRDREFIEDYADGLRELVKEHGKAVAAGFPRLSSEYLQQATLSALVAGRRISAPGYALCLVWHQPSLLRGWKLLAASLVGPSALTIRSYFKRTEISVE